LARLFWKIIFYVDQDNFLIKLVRMLVKKLFWFYMLRYPFFLFFLLFKNIQSSAWEKNVIDPETLLLHQYTDRKFFFNLVCCSNLKYFSLQHVLVYDWYLIGIP
jgi:hypothetical protein